MPNTSFSSDGRMYRCRVAARNEGSGQRPSLGSLVPLAVRVHLRGVEGVSNTERNGMEWDRKEILEKVEDANHEEDELNVLENSTDDVKGFIKEIKEKDEKDESVLEKRTGSPFVDESIKDEDENNSSEMEVAEPNKPEEKAL